MEKGAGKNYIASRIGRKISSHHNPYQDFKVWEAVSPFAEKERRMDAFHKTVLLVFGVHRVPSVFCWEGSVFCCPYLLLLEVGFLQCHEIHMGE